MLKTLAAKHKSTVTKMAARHQAKVETGDGPQDLLRGQAEAEGQAGPGNTVRRDHPAAGPAGGHHRPRPGPGPRSPHGAASRLRKRECELCETGTTVAVHQVTGLKELGKPESQPAWAALMARMRRKTLIVCSPCHDWIHANPVAHAA